MAGFTAILGTDALLITAHPTNDSSSRGDKYQRQQIHKGQDAERYAA